ncbi:MAG TPA: class D sortase [Steroidobacteraceae bacterium]|nr:class D sortase [Steroidobacteraceae bacterium]
MKLRVVAALQYGCLIAGALLVSLVAFARLDAEAGRQAGVAAFPVSMKAPNQALWSPERVQGYDSSLPLVTESPVAILRMPDLGLEVPVYASDSELHLNRGAGLIAGMGQPDTGGNVGIAGHRDGFFRVLKDARPGQRIEVETRLRRHVYRVVSTEVVDPTQVSVLSDTELPTLTLVTCYPFYFLGHAPQRFIVRGTYEWT